MSLNSTSLGIRGPLVAVVATTGALLLSAMLLLQPAGAEETGPIVAKIHADWCGTCTRMQPAWERAENELGTEARFVVLDVSDASTLKASREQAAALGIEAFFQANQSKTGTVGVLNASGEPSATFKGSLPVDEIRAAIEEAGA